MAKQLLVAAATAAAVLTSWGGGGWPVLAAAQRSAPVVFSDDVSWRRYHLKTAQSSEEDMRRYPFYKNFAVRQLMSPNVVTVAPPCTQTSEYGGDVCVDDPDYTDTIRQRVMSLLRQNAGVNAIFSDPSLRSILNDPNQPSKVEQPKVSIRVGTASESPVCAAQETIIYPKRAKTPRDDWVFVLNQEGVQQALRVEKCISDGSSCNIGMALPGNAKATCRQKYVYRRMLVLGTNKIEPEQVLMPSCCVCYTTYQDLFTRSRNATRSQTSAPEAEPSASPVSTMPAPTRVNFGRSMGGRFRRPMVINFDGPAAPVIRYPNRG